MAFKTRNYAEGDVFVPERSFGNSKQWGQGPRQPEVDPINVGPTATTVFTGPAFGDVRFQDGARIMNNPKPKFEGKLFPASNHLPENA